MDIMFYWLGVTVAALATLAAVLAAAFWIYAYLIHERFGAILFRKGQCRLSIASWHPTKLTSDKEYKADDWPVCRRPLYLSYKISPRCRLFFLAGTLEGPRFNAIHGMHPEEGR